jgi:Protein of unknown function (DUF3558)
MNRTTAALAAATILLTMSACAAPTGHPIQNNPTATSIPAQPSDPPQAAQPAHVPFDKINPCQLLTTDQQNTLDVFKVPSDPLYETGGSRCGWGSNSTAVNGVWIARLAFDQPFPTTLDSPAPVQRVQIDSYPVLEGSNSASTPDASCVQVINIAPNQTLLISYDLYGTIAGLNHRKACENATQFSTMVIDNLRALTGH